MSTPRLGTPRQLSDLVDSMRRQSGVHLPPARAHLRVAKEAYRAEVPPDAPFPRKLAAFLRNQVWGWVWSYIRFRFGPRHNFQHYSAPDNGIYPLAGSTGGQPDNGSVRVSVAGDWASGTFESEKIAELMEGNAPHFTVHLGDVYFVGDEDEMKTNCLGEAPAGSNLRGVKWPYGSVGAFALNGNHEMYANGDAYFDAFLPTLGIRKSPGGALSGQKASFFCLRNEFWDVIAIDTGYNSVGLPLLEQLPWFRPSCKLHDDLLSWLRNVVKPRESRRGIVLLSHHQSYSAFEDIFPKPAQQLAEFVDRPVLWFWGHEHRFAVYGRSNTAQGIEAYGRCIGHGGMPTDIGFPVKRPEFSLVLHDERRYETLGGLAVGYNGFANLAFRGNTLEIEYRDIDDQVLLREQWETEAGILRGMSIERGITDANIQTPKDLGVAIGKSA